MAIMGPITVEISEAGPADGQRRALAPSGELNMHVQQAWFQDGVIKIGVARIDYVDSGRLTEDGVPIWVRHGQPVLIG